MSVVWDEIYKKGDFLKLPPHPEIRELAELFKKERIRQILDLGSGGGRHTIYLASKRFDVYGLDLSSTGLAYALNILSKKGLTAHFTLHDITTLPYDDNYFDAIISVQVIHHNKLKDIRKTVGEIKRVLRNEGYLWNVFLIYKSLLFLLRQLVYVTTHSEILSFSIL